MSGKHRRFNPIYESQRTAGAAIYEDLSKLEAIGLLKRTSVYNERSALLIGANSYALNAPQNSPRVQASQQLLSVLHTPSGETLFVGELETPRGARYFVSRPPYGDKRRATLVSVIEPGVGVAAANPQAADENWNLYFWQPSSTKELYLAQNNQTGHPTVAFTATDGLMEQANNFPFVCGLR